MRLLVGDGRFCQRVQVFIRIGMKGMCDRSVVLTNYSAATTPTFSPRALHLSSHQKTPVEDLNHPSFLSNGKQRIVRLDLVLPFLIPSQVLHCAIL